MEEPNTEDRKFIKPSDEGDSDVDYAPTDPEELDYEHSEDAGDDFFRHPGKYVEKGYVAESKNEIWDMEELDTKRADHFAKEMLEDFFTPPHGHRGNKKPNTRMQRQRTPTFGEDEIDPFSASYPENTNENNSQKTHKHTQEVRAMGEVGTYDPTASSGCHAIGGHCPSGN